MPVHALTLEFSARVSLPFAIRLNIFFRHFNYIHLKSNYGHCSTLINYEKCIKDRFAVAVRGCNFEVGSYKRHRFSGQTTNRKRATTSEVIETRDDVTLGWRCIAGNFFAEIFSTKRVRRS